ncbi:MAG: acylneuraminate cytidylyltransferase family protein [Bacteroidota bacterium]
MSKVIAFVPVRCGSKSIPLKNIKPFCGKPLVYWTVKALQDSNVDEIYVATDCKEIKNTVNGFSFSKVKIYDRDPENAQDTSSTESVMLEFIGKQDFADDDKFILVQATSPLSETSDFNAALEKYLSDKAYDSLLTCVRVKKFLWNDDGTSMNYDYRRRPRRQDFNGVLMENGAFYINTVGNIERYNNRLSGKIAVYEMPEYKNVDIDEPDDWAAAEKLMNRFILYR